MELADLRPLGVDICRLDTTVPCAYWHLKIRALNGERLSQPELDWVGVNAAIPPLPGRGWHTPNLPSADGVPDPPYEPVTDQALLLELTRGRERVEIDPAERRARHAAYMRAYKRRKRAEAAATS